MARNSPGTQGRRLLQTRMQAVAGSNQIAKLLNACEGEVGAANVAIPKLERSMV